LYDANGPFKILWIIEEDDDFMQESGETLMELSELPLTFSLK
jgi:hypothetical protein